MKPYLWITGAVALLAFLPLAKVFGEGETPSTAPVAQKKAVDPGVAEARAALAAARSGLRWQEFRSRYDLDGDGQVSWTEYQKVRSGFARLDADGDGLVTKADLEKMAAERGPRRGKRPPMARGMRQGRGPRMGRGPRGPQGPQGRMHARPPMGPREGMGPQGRMGPDRMGQGRGMRRPPMGRGPGMGRPPMGPRHGQGPGQRPPFGGPDGPWGGPPPAPPAPPMPPEGE